MSKAPLSLVLLLLLAAPAVSAAGDWVVWERGGGSETETAHPLLFVADPETCEELRIKLYVIPSAWPFGRPRHRYNTVCLPEGIVPAPAAEDQAAWVLWTTSGTFFGMWRHLLTVRNQADCVGARKYARMIPDGGGDRWVPRLPSMVPELPPQYQCFPEGVDPLDEEVRALEEAVRRALEDQAGQGKSGSEEDTRP
jgi:hypothetical protein